MSATSVAVIDYGMGNLHSVSSALSHVSPASDIRITADRDTIINADRVVFPGVGAIRDCMAEIKRLHFHKLLPEVIARGKPVLAICVGMQALADSSDENNGIDCIGVLPGKVKFFGDPVTGGSSTGSPLTDDQGARLKVPHMGWNRVEQTFVHPLWQGIETNSHFYFVHSYYVVAARREHIAGRCEYGLTFTAAMAENNLFATQFHPEKSHRAGLQLLKNFVAWDGKV